MTRDAQTALRRIMETSSRTCRFVLICNYQSGIIEPIQSRCSVFRFRYLEEADAVEYLSRICKSESVNAELNALARIYEMSGGDLRSAVNYLQVAAIRTEGSQLDIAAVNKVLPVAENELIRDMIALALQAEFIKSRDVMYELMGKHGLSGREILRVANRQVARIEGLGNEKRAEIVRALGECDFRLTQGANEDIQISAMLAQFSLIGAKSV
jgi:replication factor C small subunit